MTQMALTLHRDAGTGDQVRHAISATLTDARQLVLASGVPTAERVHDARTRIKRIRALLALLRKDLGDFNFRLENRGLRNAALALGPLREAVARLEAYDQLCAHHDSTLPESVRLALSNVRDQTASQEAAELALRQTEARFAAAQARVASWPASDPGTASLVRGYRDCYAKARRSYRAAKRDPTPEAMHALRRRTKRYQYQLQFLEPVQARRLRARRRSVEALSELLGTHHDLAVLDAAFEADNHGLDESALQRLRHAIAERERTLTREALALAGRLFRERPRRVSRQLVRHLRRFAERRAR
jgi:CHAD domain-containing protein